MNCEQTRRYLGAYLDTELDLVSSLAVEDHLSTCPACAQAHREQKAMKDILQEHSPVFDAPPGLENRIRRALREQAAPRPARWHGFWPLPAWAYPAMAAAAVVVVAIVALGRPWVSRADLEREAISDHIRSLQANHLMDVASTDRHTVKPWFAGRIDFAPPVNDLATAGYPLIGGRLDVLDHRPVAALVFQHRKHFINLFVWPVAGTPAGSRQSLQDGYRVHAWTDSGMNFLAVSDMDSDGLEEFVRLQRAASP